MLGIIVLSIRIADIHENLGDKLANPSILKAVMRTITAEPEFVDIPKSQFPDGESSGLRARAMSEIAQAAGQSVTAEIWLIHGLVDPSSAYLSQFELCLLYWNEGRRDRALNACRGTKSSAVYWLNQGYLADERGDKPEALAYYEMAGFTDPDMVDAWHHIGITLFSLKRYDEAIEAYERVMALDPTPSPDVYDSLGQSYLQNGNPTMAREVLNRGLMIYPSRREYYVGMADTYRVENDLDSADSWYARTLQRWPNDAQVWSARGDVASRSGRQSDAIEYYQHAAENQPEGFGYWMSLASTAAMVGDIPLATESYRSALALRPDDVGAWLHAGRFFVNSNQMAEAKEVFEHILVLQPDNDEAAIQLAEIRDPSNE